MSEGRGGYLPGNPPQIPGLPTNFQPIQFEIFEGMNTKPPRPAVDDKESFWIDGFMPIGPSNLRTLYGPGTPRVTSPPATVVWFGFGNIGDTQYLPYLCADGGLYWSPVTSGGGGTILPPGTITNPRSVFGFSQWGSLYLIFSSDQTNGYWLWDGTSTYGPGTLSPYVTVTNGGDNYTSAPVWGIETTGGGTGVGFSSQLDNDSVSLVNVTNPGHGFGEGDFAILTASGGGSDTQATGSASIGGGGVLSVTITNPGSAYTYAATITFAGGGATAQATGVLNIQNGQITGVALTFVGIGYTSPPTITIADPGYGTGSAHINGGGGATGFVTIGGNGLNGLAVTNGGTNYTSQPQVQIIGDGTGAQAVAVLSGGVVSSLNLTNPGQGYTVALVAITGGNNAANATVEMMPFGISGTSAEVQIGRAHV